LQDKRNPLSCGLDARPHFMVLAPGHGPARRIAAAPRFEAHHALNFRLDAQAMPVPSGNHPLVLFERRPLNARATAWPALKE
jgi:hypothetical protein